MFTAVISEHFSKKTCMIISVLAAKIWYLKNVRFLLGHPVCLLSTVKLKTTLSVKENKYINLCNSTVATQQDFACKPSTVNNTTNAPVLSTTYKLFSLAQMIYVTCALNSSVSLGGSFLESPATFPRRISLTETFLTLKPTLSPGLASSSAVWCISTDFTSVVTFTGANVTIIPALSVPVSTRPTGTVPIPTNKYTNVKRAHESPFTELRGVTCHMGSRCYLPPDTSECTPP